MPSATLVGRRSPNRSPNRNNNGRPRLRQGQVRRIVALIITLVILLYLDNYSMEMSAADALKVRHSIFNSIIKFKNIVQTCFAGHENIIEAGASSIAAILQRKFQTGTLRLNAANIAVGTVAFGMTYRNQGSHTSNFITHLHTRNASLWRRMTGRTRRNADNIRNVIISMIAWLISGLRYFAAENVAGVVREELRVRGLERATPARILNYGATVLRLTF